jgi:hypothetical protein
MRFRWLVGAHGGVHRTPWAGCDQPGHSGGRHQSGRHRISGAGRCPWLDTSLPVAQRLVLAKMTLADKLTLMHANTKPSTNGSTGSTSAIPRLCIPEVTQEDGPAGVAGATRPSTPNDQHRPRPALGPQLRVTERRPLPDRDPGLIRDPGGPVPRANRPGQAPRGLQPGDLSQHTGRRAPGRPAHPSRDLPSGVLRRGRQGAGRVGDVQLLQPQWHLRLRELPPAPGPRAALALRRLVCCPVEEPRN